MIKKTTYILLLLFAVFLFAPNVYADDDECDPCPRCYSGQCVGSFAGESGGSPCGGVVRERWCDPCCGGCWYVYNPGYPWQKCQSQCSWHWPCAGDCLDIPKDPSYNGKVSSVDVLLPVTLSWRNVPGFGWGGSSPRSYDIEITDTNANPLDFAPKQSISTLDYFTERIPTGQCLRFTPEDEIPSFTYKESPESENKGRKEQAMFSDVLKSTSSLNSSCSNLAKYYDDKNSDREYSNSCNWGASNQRNSIYSFLRIKNHQQLGSCVFYASNRCLAYNNQYYQQSCLYDFIADNCLLRSDDSFSFRTRACCSLSGDNCGEWSDWWDFETSSAPEVLSVGTPTEDESFFAILLGAETVVGQAPEVVDDLRKANLYWCDTRKLQTMVGSTQTHYDYYDRYEIEVQQRLPKFTFWQTFQDHPLVKARNTPIYSISTSVTDAKPETNILNQEYLLFTKNDYSSYRWRVRACDRNEPNLVCTDYSDWHYFEVSKDVVVDNPRLTYPGDDPDGKDPISWPIQFSWDSPVGANSYIFELLKDGSSVYKTVVKSTIFEGAVSRLNSVVLSGDKLRLDTSYSWRVKSCWDELGRNDYCEAGWSQRSFKTTGGVPEIVYPLNEEAIIPVRFEWKLYPGAQAYLFTLDGESRIVADNNITIEDLEMDKIYTWSVSSCNSVDDSECGDPAESSFRTVELQPSKIISPGIGEKIHSKESLFVDFKWSDVLGVNTYYLKASCTPEDGSGTITVLEEIVKKTERRLNLSCVGDYSWEVSACIDPECENVGIAALGSFSYIKDEGGTGFIPCGLNHNNSNTQWDETEKCEVKHIFILFKNILDFVLWKITPFLLIMLVIYSGIIFYTSLGNVKTLTRIKSIWISIRNGLLIIISAWFIVELIMILMGYNLSTPWWEIKI